MSDVMSKAHAHELVQSYLAARSRIQEVEVRVLCVHVCGSGLICAYTVRDVPSVHRCIQCACRCQWLVTGMCIYIFRDLCVCSQLVTHLFFVGVSNMLIKQAVQDMKMSVFVTYTVYVHVVHDIYIHVELVMYMCIYSCWRTYCLYVYPAF